MAYHTSVYLVLFLPLSLLAYQITPQKKRWITLLTCNYLFFWLISAFVLFRLMYEENDGKLRWFVIMGVLADQWKACTVSYRNDSVCTLYRGLADMDKGTVQANCVWNDKSREYRDQKKI